MGKETVNNKDTPKPVLVAQEALKAFENDPFYEALKKALIPLAVQMERSGDSPTVETLKIHAEKGVEHVNSIRKTFSTKAQKQQKSYSEIIVELNQGTEFEKQESIKKEEDLSYLTAFEKAAYIGDVNTAEKLIQDTNQDDKDSALIHATKLGHVTIVKLLLENGANINVRGINECSPLQLSTVYDHTEVVKVLLDAGADAKARYNYALKKSFSNGNPVIVELLLKAGADINDIRYHSFERSALNRHIGIVQIFIDHGESLGNADLTEKQRKNIEVRLENLKLWREMYGSEPPKGLDGENPHGFKPELFEAVKSWLIEEGHEEKDANKYAYGASTLFKNETQILQYLEKWGEAGKQPLHNLTYMIKLPLTGKIDSKAWADASIKFGSEMAKLVSFADKLPKPVESLNKTREKCAEFNYERGSEHKTLASLCVNHNVDENDFEKALEIVLKNPNPTSNIPDIKISGDRFGMEGYSFEKLPDGDIRGLFLGEITGCCQSIGGVGSACAEKGYASEDSGFYVVMDAKQKIIGQAWGWLGKNDELVFDSLESLTDRITTKQWQDICTETAKEIEASLNIGTGGETPAMSFNRASSPATPKTPCSYSDARQQYRVGKKQKIR